MNGYKVIRHSEWNELAILMKRPRGISGVTRYDDSVYSQRLVWDPIAKTSKAKYFYWVANKKTVPAVDFRKISANEVTNLIQNPAGQGYKFVALMGKNRYALFNCASVMDDRNIALNLRYYTLDNKTQNIHNEYSLLTQGLGSSKPTRDIERKWFDSLIGYDTKRRTVSFVHAKAKYGIQNSPRQSMFINRTEVQNKL